MKIRIKLRDNIVWEGSSDHIDEIKDMCASWCAKRVVVDGMTCHFGLWTASVVEEDKTRCDRYHRHEMLDRCYLVMDFIYEQLKGHPAYIKYKSVRTAVDRLSEAAGDAYQVAGSLK